MSRDAKHLLSVQNQWLRDPSGPSLPKPPPNGHRTANGIIWGHTLNDFHWVQRHPGINVFTIWSRSMIQEFGENFAGVEHEYEPSPRLLRPWPILQLPPGITSDPPLGLVDETCFCNHIRVPLSVNLYDDYGNLLPPVEEPVAITFGEGLDSPTKTDANQPESSGIEGAITVPGDIIPGSDSEKETSSVDQIDGKPENAGGESESSKSHVSHDTNTNSTPDVKSDQADAAAPKVCLESIPKLEEFIPEEYFPDILLVNDPNQTISGNRVGSFSQKKVESSAKPFKYKRVLPKLERSPDWTPRVAHLNMGSAELLGEGHHSFVYRALFRPPEPLTARSPTGEVRVAAKMAMQEYEARQLLGNESVIYDAFPRHLMEHYCGLNLVSPLRNPVPVGPVVPKFYGYYKRHYEEGEVEVEDSVYGSSPILLVEECGEQYTPAKYSENQRLEMYSLLLRLHNAGFLQQSLYTRNILVQPGPLTKPPSQRSIGTPSFRIIDFGRAISWVIQCRRHQKEYKPGGDVPESIRENVIGEGVEWYENKDYEIRKAASGTIINSTSNWDY